MTYDLNPCVPLCLTLRPYPAGSAFGGMRFKILSVPHITENRYSTDRTKHKYQRAIVILQ